MRFLSWLDGLKLDSSRRRTKRGQPRSPRRKPAGCKPSVESLEDRSMPSFLGPVNYTAGFSPEAVVSADFNNDALLDLAVGNSSSGTVSVLLGNADGTFQPAQNSAPVNPASLAVGDFNGDGLPGDDRADGFFRRFGDSDGDGDVDHLDRDFFRSAFKTSAGDANYLWYLDFDGDGNVDGLDNGQFNRRFGQY